MQQIENCQYDNGDFKKYVRKREQQKCTPAHEILLQLPSREILLKVVLLDSTSVL